MRICQVVPSLEARHGGPSKSVLALSAALAARGEEVDLVATDPRPDATYRAAGVRVTTFPRDWPQWLSRSRGLRQWLAASEAQVYHHHSLWLRTLHYTRARAARDGVFVVSPRGMMGEWAWQHRRARKWLAARLVHPGAFAAVDGWHATSAAEESDIRRLGFRQPVCVAPNGVDAPVPDATAAAKKYWEETCPALPGRRTALFYARFHRKKRVLELIDAWLSDAPRDWLLLLVGIPEEYTPEHLQAYAEKRGGSGRVAAFSGLDRPPPYSAASLFLLPSHDENFGLVIAEASAHGLPAIVTDTTPWQGLNHDARGWCVPWPEFPAALRAATAESPEQLQARGERARSWVLRDYSWRASADKLAEFYQRLRRSA